MRKLLTAMLAIALTFSLAACGQKPAETTTAVTTTAATTTTAAETTAATTTSGESSAVYQDGTYYAESPEFADNGWKGNVTLTISGGKISDVKWNAVSNNPDITDDKVAYSANGGYGMVAKGGASAEWHEQAALVDAALIENQDPEQFILDDGGYTDAIAGVTIHIDEFKALAIEALNKAKTGDTSKPETTSAPEAPADSASNYVDGTYFAESPEFASNGWKGNVTITVSGGKISDVKWNATSNNPEITDDKVTYSENGGYGMVAKGGAIAEWHEQAALVDAALIANQDPEQFVLDDGGYTDAIAGVSIHIDEFKALAIEALSKAKGGEAQTQASAYKDGTYTAESAEFASNGWKGNVTVTVAGGKISDVVWNATSNNPEITDDKITYSENGGYGMVAKGGAIAEWHEQAALASAALIANQDPEKFVLDDGGYTDAIAGVTIHIDEFKELAIEALAQAK